MIAIALLSSTVNAAAYIAVQVEAENYQSKHSDWRVFSDNSNPNVRPDPDGSHHSSASGRAYVELLPDTRVTHGDQLVSGRNFWNEAGTGPSLSYSVNIPEAGRYLVFARAYSTGSEDNGIHVGLNNSNPASGHRMQWCNGKNQWTWSSAQRTSSNHCGVARNIYLDFSFAGANTVTFSAREDGFELDKFILIKESESALRCAPQGASQINCNLPTSNNNSPQPMQPTNPPPAPVQPAPEPQAPVNNDNSTMTSEIVACTSANSDPDGDGYGWENQRTCIATAANAATPQSSSTLPRCQSDFTDPDGDGYGWENNQSCLAADAAASANNAAVIPCRLSNSDSDGDGWGWENNQSCRVQ
ncbi:hypothetical protein AB833_23755 [Chromatiales bacterium (ex Bugula neritina AB1)]|nr:hypothetical protein AB833_23755 [Chromatiales bacterium (ex Bugula neritina AB1)]